MIARLVLACIGAVALTNVLPAPFVACLYGNPLHPVFCARVAGDLRTTSETRSTSGVDSDGAPAGARR